MKPIRKDKIIDNLKKTIFSKKIEIFENIESTNTFANEIAGKGAPEGTVIIAEEQNAGKGRMGRIWVSPKYANLLMSVIIRPEIHVEEIFALNMVMALAVTDAIKDIFGLNAKIKWPNDIYLNMKKLGGILTEISAKGREIDYAVVGLGLNVNWKPETVSEMRYPAICLSEEVGYEVSREKIISTILIKLELFYRMVSKGLANKLLKLWSDRSILTGKTVEIDTGTGTVSGRVFGIDRRGSLIIESEEGNEQRVIFGDVSVKEITNESTNNRKNSR